MTTYDDYRELEALLENGGVHAIEALDRNARELADKVAVTYGETGERLTFGELGERTDALAGNLHRLGVQPGDVVNVLSTNPLLACVAMIGVWKAGAIFAPVNFQYTGQLLTYTLNDAGATLVIVDEGLVGTIADVWTNVTRQPRVVLQGERSDLPFETTPYDDLFAPADRPEVSIEFDTPCSLIYTSGTTGPSKGVLHPHRWITQYTWGLRRRLTTDDVLYNDLPMYHVGGAYANLLAGLWPGAEVQLWDRFSPNEFWKRIESGSCTMAILLDVMIPWLSQAPETDRDRYNTLNKAHMQPLPVSHHAFAKRFGIDSVTAGFGQTESGSPASMLIEECAPGEGTPDELYRGKTQAQLRADMEEIGGLVLPGDQVTRKAMIGIAAPWFEVTVLDDQDRPCPPGQAGHLAVRPKLPGTLFREYVGKPDKTVEAWGNLWFHTGDSVVQDDNGYYYFLDRLGDRIRVRGENVSSVHVEELVGSHPGVDVCAAVGIPSARSDEDEIVAFVQASAGSGVTEDELRAHAEQVMPKFMRPYHYRFVEELPKTPTNKIEKHKLRAMMTDPPEGS